MTEVRFYGNTADELTETHGKCPEAIGRAGKRFELEVIEMMAFLRLRNM